MTLSQLCWISIAGCGLHILEELVLDWRGWTASITGIRVGADLFYAGNALFLILGLVAAEIAPSLPAEALVFPAVMLLNAIFFHIGGTLLHRGRFSPGLLTAVLLLLPLGIACYRVAWRSGLISGWNVVESLGLGAVVMVSPILLLRLSGLRYFQQTR